jgi:DNA polymerase-3 subunit alpha
MESDGMKKTLQIVKPNSFKDIANVLALYRPGPKEFIADYVQNRNVFKFKGVIKEILEDTHGIIVFQEQIILIATNMAGYNLGQADLLRRAIAKKDEVKINQIGIDFVKRSINRGVDAKEAQMTFDLIAKFANYGFNKAHAYAYAMIVYQMSYLKVHFPQIFYSELFYFNFKTPKKMDFLSELERQKIHLINPDILQSDLKVSIEGNNLRIGFLVIDSIGIEVAEGIINARQYIKDTTSLIEVVFEVLHKINISSTQVSKLIDAGCFDRYGYNRATLKTIILNLIETDAFSLYKMGGEIDIEIEEEYSFEKNCLFEKNALSINIKYDQFKEVLKQKQAQFNQKIYTLDQVFYHQINPSKQIYNDEIVLIKLMGIKEIRTKKGELMCFLTVISTQAYDITVFSREYATYSKALNNSVGHYLICQVNINEDKIFLKKV